MKFNDYYLKYLTYHKKFGTRLMHCLGNVATVVFIIWAILNQPWALLLSPFIIYLFAWPSHWWIEGNKPAAFKNPIKAKMADWRMMFDMIRGKI